MAFRRRRPTAVKTVVTSPPRIFGAGPVIAGTVVGDVADVSRFASQDRFAAYNGTAPIEVSSGNRKVRRRSPHGNRRINHAVHMAAITQIRHRHSDGRAYYDRKVAEGKTHKEALRSLKRRISDAIYSRLQADARRAAAAACAKGPEGNQGTTLSPAWPATPPVPALRPSHSRARINPTTLLAAPANRAPRAGRKSPEDTLTTKRSRSARASAAVWSRGWAPRFGSSVRLRSAVCLARQRLRLGLADDLAQPHDGSQRLADGALGDCPVGRVSRHDSGRIPVMAELGVVAVSVRVGPRGPGRRVLARRLGARTTPVGGWCAGVSTRASAPVAVQRRHVHAVVIDPHRGGLHSARAAGQGQPCAQARVGGDSGPAAGSICIGPARGWRSCGRAVGGSR